MIKGSKPPLEIRSELLIKHKEALRCFDEIIKINPKDAEAWYNRGNSLSRLEKDNDAFESYKEVIKINQKLRMD